MSITKNVLLNWYSSMKKKLRKIIFDIDSSPLTQFSKFNNFLWKSWFLCKNISNFVPPAWKLHNPYCHIQEDSSRPFVLSSPSNGIIQTDHVGGINSNPQDTLYGDMHWYNYYSDGWDPQSYPQGMFSDILS